MKIPIFHWTLTWKWSLLEQKKGKLFGFMACQISLGLLSQIFFTCIYTVASNYSFIINLFKQLQPQVNVLSVY